MYYVILSLLYEYENIMWVSEGTHWVEMTVGENTICT